MISIFSLAQIDVYEGFESSSPGIFSYYGFYRSSVAFPCTGSYCATKNFRNDNTTGDITYYTTASNGGKLDISFKYRTYVFDNASVNGNLRIYYSIDGGNNYISYETINLSSEFPCRTWSTTFPQGFVPVGTNFRIMIQGNWTSGNYNVSIDDIALKQSPLMATAEISEIKSKIYPNPFTDVIHIDNVDAVRSITISDFSGRKLKTINEVSKEIKLPELKKGNYILTIDYKDGGKNNSKVIKK